MDSRRYNEGLYIPIKIKTKTIVSLDVKFPIWNIQPSSSNFIRWLWPNTIDKGGPPQKPESLKGLEFFMSDEPRGLSVQITNPMCSLNEVGMY